jgi:hypothetical protein
MDMLKKNWFSVVCGVIAVLAIVAVPTFISSQQKVLQKALDARVATNTSLTTLKNASRHQPVVSIDPNATPPDLKVFPGPAVIEAGKAAITQVQTQSVELEKLVTDMNRHTLLVPGSLPQPGSVPGSDAFSFGRAYIDEVEKGIPARLNSTTPPTDAEIDARKAEETAAITEKSPKNATTGKPLNQPALDEQIARRVAELPDEMRRNAANQHKIYMFPTALSIHPDFAASANAVNQQLDAEKIWYAQLGLWVQEDVVNSIIELNKNSKNVAESPVKQLVGIETSFGQDIYTMPVAGAAAPAPIGQAAASPVAANAVTDPLPKDFSVSPTGHVCNGVFDVVHFTVCMHVQSADIIHTIQELERDRLLTAMISDVVVVNSFEEKDNGFLYGPQPVVTLTLKCEELFLRSWTRPLMPQPVKTMLNVQEPAQQTAMSN